MCYILFCRTVRRLRRKGAVRICPIDRSLSLHLFYMEQIIFWPTVHRRRNRDAARI